MNAKDLYWRALEKFRERNEEVLPQLQLQYGANERWLQREFALAINCYLSGSWRANSMRRYADCEFRHGDIVVWEGRHALALYEVKALYSKMSRATLHAFIKKAAIQLKHRKVVESDRKLGLFFAMFCRKGQPDDLGNRVSNFKKQVRDGVRMHFKSDHHIRMTQLSPLTEINYGSDASSDLWHTQSWVTWGTLNQ